MAGKQPLRSPGCYHFATTLRQSKPIQHALDGYPVRLSS
jgi:hypothetical protein